MRPDRPLAMALLALVVSTAAPRVAAAPDPVAADAAFDAGDEKAALALYDEILAARPDDVHALLCSGMLLSWSKKYDEALARYAKALSVDPGAAKVKLERAKVLLWSKRYDEARPAFQSVLQDDPRESWALLGMAQSYAWTGQSAKALPWYRRALAVQPDMKEAQIGLAYAELETGDAPAAEERARALKAKEPDDKEVQELDRAVRKARAPWISIGYDRISDSDDNRMGTWRLEGGLGLPRRLDLRFGLARTDVAGAIPGNTDADGSADALYGVLDWQRAADQRGELRVGAARLTDSSGDTRTTGIGGVSYAFPIASWRARAGLARDPFLYSPEILDNAIDVTTLSFGASGSVSRRVRVEAGAAYGDFSDGNRRIGVDAGAWYVWTWPKRELLLGPVVRYVDFSEETSSGYFDPQNLVAAVASLHSSGAIGGSKWSYEGVAEAGVQSYTFQGANASHRPLASVYGSVSHPLPHGIGLDLYAGWANSSTAAGPGFHSVSFGAKLRFTIGG